MTRNDIGGWIALLVCIGLMAYIAWTGPRVPRTVEPTIEACHTVYADSFDIRGAVIEGELDVFDALQLGPESYRTMVLEAYQTERTTGAFSARWLGMCLAGRIQPREVD